MSPAVRGWLAAIQMAAAVVLLVAGLYWSIFREDYGMAGWLTAWSCVLKINADDDAKKAGLSDG